MVYFLEIVGTVAFAISGVMASRRRRPDFIGAIILAFVTAIGGGVVRDAILGVTSKSFTNPHLFYIIFTAAIFSIFLADKVDRIGRVLSIADAIGLGIFNAGGLTAALYATHLGGIEISVPFAILLGVTTGCGGGIIRDVLCARMPTLLRPSEIYISACIIGGLFGVLCYKINTGPTTVVFVTATVTTCIRILSIRYKWKIPAIGSGKPTVS